MTKFRRRMLALCAMCAAGVVFQIPAGCATFGAQAIISSFNACSVLNCESGAFFDFCAPIPLLVDCLNVANVAP